MLKTKAVIAFDLHDAGNPEYEVAYKILNDIGLYEFSPSKGVDLPASTAYGELVPGIPADHLRDHVWRKFEEKGLKPKRLFGGILDDWAVKKRDY